MTLFATPKISNGKWYPTPGDHVIGQYPDGSLRTSGGTRVDIHGNVLPPLSVRKPVPITTSDPLNPDYPDANGKVGPNPATTGTLPPAGPSVSVYDPSKDPTLVAAAGAIGRAAGDLTVNPGYGKKAAPVTTTTTRKTTKAGSSQSTTNPGDAGSTGNPVDTGGQAYYDNLVKTIQSAAAGTQLTPEIQTAMAKQAAAMASSQVNSSVGAAKAERNQYVQEAANRAAAVMAAYRAMAGMSQGDASRVQDAYRTAGSDLSSIASGFTGSLGTQADKEAKALNGQIGQATNPAHGGIHPDAMANALYAMNGSIPGGLFARTAARDYSAALHEPKGIMNTGIDAMQVAQHASDTKEQAINNYINTVKAKLPSLTQTALHGLMNNWLASGNAKLKVAAMQIAAAEAARKGTQADIKLTNDQGKLSFDEWYKQSGRTIQQQNADTARYRADHPASAMLKPKDIWKTVESVALGESKTVTTLGKPQNFLTKPSLNDPGNAIRYVMSHTGMSETEAMAALQTYNGLRVQNGLAPYNFPAYLAFRDRHTRIASVPPAAGGTLGPSSATVGV